MKFLKRAIVLLAAVSLLSGCTKSTIINKELDEDMPAPTVDGIVWEQLWEDFHEIYEDTDVYPFAGTVSASIDPENSEANFFLLLNEDISAEEAAVYATEVLKGFNDLAAEQNSSYTASSDESYGSYLGKYNIYVMVSHTDLKADKASWILEDRIPAGTYRAVDPAAAPVVSETAGDGAETAETGAETAAETAAETTAAAS